MVTLILAGLILFGLGSAQNVATRECMEVANESDCAVFNKCCAFKCRDFDHTLRRDHFCMALFGRIQKSECVCNSASRPRSTSFFGYPHMDLVTGVFFICVLDFVLMVFAM